MMEAELDETGQHRVFGDLVEIPEGRRALPSYCVYKIKCEGAGYVHQFMPSRLGGENC
jgi:hypothetical protein